MEEKNVKSIKSLNKKYEENVTQSQEEILKNSLLKKARGFIVEEIIEESVKNENATNLSLVKRKVTTKEIPPDMNAIKYLMEIENLNQDKYSNLTDEELQQEKLNLLKLLKEEDFNEGS